MTPERSQSNLKIGPKQARFLPMAFVAMYLAIMIYIHHCLRPDQILLIFIFASVVLFGGKTGKRFIIDWAPFTIFIILYDGMRGFADNFGVVHVSQPYHLELSLFGWATGGKVLPFILQVFRNTNNGTAIVNILDIVSGTLYSLHFLSPFVFGWLLWSIYRDRKEFYFFAYSLTILNILALVTFFFYPAAPPWYVWQHHFARPMVQLINYGNAASLVNFDVLLQFPLFKSVYENMNPNAFAAIPSLHGSYPFLITCFAFRKWRTWPVRSLFVAYTATTWFAACYLNHHYVVDLLIGAFYVFIAIQLYRYILGPFIIDPWLLEGTVHEAGQIKHPMIATGFFIVGGLTLLGSVIFYAIRNT